MVQELITAEEPSQKKLKLNDETNEAGQSNQPAISDLDSTDTTDAILNVDSTDIVNKGASTSAGFGCSSTVTTSSLNTEAKQRSQQQPNVSELFQNIKSINMINLEKYSILISITHSASPGKTFVIHVRSLKSK